MESPQSPFLVGIVHAYTDPATALMSCPTTTANVLSDWTEYIRSPTIRQSGSSILLQRHTHYESDIISG